MPHSRNMFLCVTFMGLLQHAVCAVEKNPDFLIVGAGTAGCVLAARLCESLPTARIILLERGNPRDETAERLVRSPATAFAASISNTVSEIYQSESIPGLNNRTVDITTGNTLGGSSSTNSMQWTIPYNGTVEAWGIGHLTSETAKKYYARAFAKLHPAIQRPGLKQLYVRDHIKAGKKVGIPETMAPFDGKVEVSQWENYVAVDKSGRRVDSCSAYLTPALSGKCSENLSLMQGVTVSKLLIQKRRKMPKVTGVEYYATTDTGLNIKKTMHAEEVIVSAGPFGSPKLLQLSGIGPKRLLEKVGIDVVLDLDVGTKTQIRGAGVFTSLYTGVPLEPANDPKKALSRKTREKFDSGSGGLLGKALSATNGRLKRDAYFSMASVFPNSTNQGIPLLVTFCLGNTDSTGYLRIKDKNPFTTPRVQLNLLGSSGDVARMLRCMKRMSKLHGSFPKRFGMVPVSATGPALNEQYLRETSGSGLHFVGGCAVGLVVSREMKVRGISRLRVADASVLKFIPDSAGTMASTYMVAEFVADSIITGRKRKESGTGM